MTPDASPTRHLALVPALPPHVVRHPVHYGGVRAAGLPHPSQLPPLADDLPLVAAVGVPGTLTRALLDPAWRLVPPRPGVDVVVTAQPDADVLHALHRRCPGALLLAVLPATAPSGDTVALLAAGVDVCVRGADPREVAAHVTAMVRRRSSSPLRPRAIG